MIEFFLQKKGVNISVSAMNCLEINQVTHSYLLIYCIITIGGGVTVQYGKQLMNLLPIRRARPRLLVNGPQGITFHPDVAEVRC